MLDGTTNPDVKDLISGHAREQAAPNVKRMLFLGAAVIAGLVVVAALTVFLIVENREKEIVANVEHRAEIAVSGHTAVLATWLEGLAQLAGNLTESGLFRLFAAEVDLAGTSTALPSALKEQLPYMQLAINEFAGQSGITGAYMIGRDGRVYLANVSAPALTPDQRRAAQVVFETGEQTVLPLAVAKDGLQLNILFPVTPAQVAAPRDAQRTVGVMLVATAASSKVAEIMVSGPFAQEGERTRFFQVTVQGSEEIVPWKTPFLRPVSSPDLPPKLAPLSFATRTQIGGDVTVLSSGMPVPNTPWLLVREVDEAAVLAPLTTYRLVGGGLALLTTVLIAAAFVAVWWRQTGVYNQALALQFQNLAAQIQAQRQLLDSINNSIDEQIGLKNLDGRYIYANPAFARAVGRDLDEVINLNDTAIFGEDTARRLGASDKRVLRTGGAEIIDEELALLDRQRCLTISKAPLRDDDGNIIGIVSVARDVTEQIEHQQKMKQAIDATIAALVHTVEMHDPYLAGHSDRMCEIGREIGQRLSLPGEDIATLEMAANLSQIGKLSIPEKLLTKKARLTPVEEVVVQGHIQRTEEILKEIDFGLPVCETVAQMHERLDGTGYPRGLRNDEIDLLGRIIGAVDVYCARIEPRGYRATISSREALDILENNPDKYDADVIAALRQYVDETVKEPAVT
jgi:PAS domain S-box-containing protein